MSGFTGWTAAAVLIVSFALVGPSGSRASSPVASPDAEVARAVVAYMEAIDAGDLERQMSFWSEDSAATSVIMGEVWRGRASIRARSAEYVPVSKRVRDELGPVSVLALGEGSALSVVPYRPVRRDPADDKLAPWELDSMLTLVWTRTPAGWRIVHEHVSVKVPPPGSE